MCVRARAHKYVTLLLVLPYIYCYELYISFVTCEDIFHTCKWQMLNVILCRALLGSKFFCFYLKIPLNGHICRWWRRWVPWSRFVALTQIMMTSVSLVLEGNASLTKMLNLFDQFTSIFMDCVDWSIFSVIFQNCQNSFQLLIWYLKMDKSYLYLQKTTCFE